MRLTDEQWLQIINYFNSSGLTKEEYSLKNNIKYATLCYQIRKRNTSFCGFIETNNKKVFSDDEISNKPRIEITINKMKISIFCNYDEDLLLSVLRTVNKV